MTVGRVVIFLVAFLCQASAVHAVEESNKCIPLLRAEKRHHWTESEILRVFSELSAREIEINSTAFRDNNSPDANAVIAEIVGPSLDARKLYYACVKMFGSFEAAKKAAGLDPFDGRKNVQWKYVEPKPFFDKIVEAGIRLNQASIIKDNAQRVSEIISDILKIQVSAASFFMGMRSRYGGWDEAVIANGYDPGEHRQLFPADTSKGDVIKAVRTLYYNGHEVHSTAMRAGGEGYASVIYKAIGIRISGAALEDRGAKHCGGFWTELLREARLPVEEIVKQAPTIRDPGKLLKMLQFLRGYYPQMNYSQMLEDSDRITRLCYARFHTIVTFKTLNSASRRFFGGWQEAIEAAGIERGIQWNRDLVSGLLRFLVSKRINLYSESFLSNSELIRRLIKAEFYQEIGPRTIYKAAFKYFGSWAAAHQEAGFKGRAQRNGDPTDNIAIIPHVTFYETDESGVSRRERQIGEAPKTPEEELLASDQKSNVQNAIDGLDTDEKAISEALLDYLEVHDDLRKQAEVLLFVKNKSGIDCDWKTVTTVLGHLSGELSEAAE